MVNYHLINILIESFLKQDKTSKIITVYVWFILINRQKCYIRKNSSLDRLNGSLKKNVRRHPIVLYTRLALKNE